jgi:hypothetical protein
MTGLSDIFEIARACGRPKRTSRGVNFCCPCHEDRSPSCSAMVGEHAIIVHCFAGCEKHDVLDALRAMGFTLTLSEGEARSKRDLTTVLKARRIIDRDNKLRTELARELWNEARSVRGSRAEHYLEQRGLSLGRFTDLDRALRFHPNCPKRRERWPAMLAAFRDIVTDEVVAVHRIFLDRLDHKVDKMMLGPSAETAVKLTPHGATFNGQHFCARLYVTEGIETGVAAHMLGYAPVWALGSCGAIASLPPLLCVGELVVLADHDVAGVKCAMQATATWREAGFQARIVMPERDGDDFADVVLRGERRQDDELSGGERSNAGGCRHVG